ncbi:PAS domain-containing sensor histidine kinase [Nonlabens antarcticus]|uniref:PAS domain-containing sensor histidine kinase n=1 Tax=Nonlabens antarcticus TaxID=392714 RepID=UPI00189161DF|nr:PAS domain-containing sensor histidine kinase [Nonlabens antarcticus]
MSKDLTASSESIHIPMIFEGGLMGEAIRNKDWKATVMGDIKQWSPQLITILNTIISSKFPYILFWGDENRCFINDAYLPSLGLEFEIDRLLGVPAHIFWEGDVWDKVAGPEIAKIKNGSQANWSSDELIPIVRNGRIEDVYWTYSYSPVRDKLGNIGGALVTVMETTDKVKNFSALEESRNQLHFAMEAANIATWEWRPKENILYGNDRLKKWFNQEGTQSLDIENFLATIIDSDKSRVKEAMTYALDPDTSPKYDIIYNIVNEPGKDRVVRAQGMVYFDENRIATRFNGVIQDITKQYEIEVEQKKLTSLFQYSSELILLTNQKGIITGYNPAAEKYLGDIVSNETNILSCLHLADKSEAREILRELSSGRELSMELRFINNIDLTAQWMLTNFSQIIEESTGKIIAFAVTGSNIDAIKEKEHLLEKINASLMESESRFKRLANNTPAFIVMTDVSGKLTFVNEHWLAFLNTTKKELFGSTLDQYLHPQDLIIYKKTYEKAIKTSSEFNLEYRIKDKNGMYNWISSVGVPRYDVDGKFDGYTNAAMNINELKIQERQKDLFIGMASHELNTPVTSIKGYVQLLNMKYGKGDDLFLSKTLHTIDSQISLLTGLIRDLLDLSKMKSGGLKLDKTTFEFKPFLHDVLEQQEIINPDHTYKLTGKLKVNVKADKERLRQVLINFLSNAVKYAPESKSIDVAVEIENKTLTVSVTDYGIGINKSNEKKVFKRFFREEGSDEKTFPGFGIGLFIAADIIKKHRGKIGVKSAKGKGSTFYFSLPSIIN